jgi:hypothetical protein
MATLELRAKDALMSWQNSSHPECNIINNELEQLMGDAQQSPILKISHRYFSSA